MAQIDPVTFRQLPLIKKIISDEVWFEGERRGSPVSPEDPVVQDHVCEVILRVGCELRERVLAQLAEHPGPSMLPMENRSEDHAA